jgi:hypothetical protein
VYSSSILTRAFKSRGVSVPLFLPELDSFRNDRGSCSLAEMSRFGCVANAR